MAPLLPTSSTDFVALISAKLNVNPLLLSLYAVSPADAWTISVSRTLLDG